MASTETREEELLEAACRVITRGGAHALRMSAVAREAGVSSALLHYYFRTKDELLARAFSYAEERVRRHVALATMHLPTAADQLERFLELYVADDVVFRENWVIWNELWASAFFDSKLRPAIESAYRDWVGDIRMLLRDGQRDGSVPDELDPAESATRLAAVVDGIGTQVVIGLLDRDRAAEMIRDAFLDELMRRRRLDLS